jgi:WD40 repeat protein
LDAARRWTPRTCQCNALLCVPATQLVATASDNTVRVWAMPSGTPEHVLEGHKQPAHVLECHPTDPRIAMSAGYDGQVIMWDIELGVQLAR